MKTELLEITGMTCGGCTSKVAHALNKLSGVSDVKLSLASGAATVQYDERLASPEQLKAAVQSAGYSTDAAETAQKSPSKGGCGCGCG